MQAEIKHVENALSLLTTLRQQVKNFNTSLSYLEHKDIGVNHFLNKAKHLAEQGLDLHAAIEHQLLLLKGELNNFNVREKYKLQQEEKNKEHEERKLKRRML